MRRAWVLGVAVAIAIAGCGRSSSRDSGPLQFEELPDTAKLSKGEPLLTRIEPYRAGGVLKIRGRLEFPDGTRLQISIYRKGTQEMVTRLQTLVQDHRFDTPPIVTPTGPVPAGAYRFE